MSPSVRTRPRSGPNPAPAPLPLSVTSLWASSAKTATRTSPPPSAKPNTTTTCSSPSSASQQPCEQEKRLCPQPCSPSLISTSFLVIAVDLSLVLARVNSRCLRSEEHTSELQSLRH